MLYVIISIVSCFLRSMHFFIYLLVVVISLLFYKAQIAIIRTILPVFPSCWLHLWWPIQGEYNCEYPSNKGKENNGFVFCCFSSYCCPASHYYIQTLWGCPAILCSVWFHSSACPEIPFVGMGINLKWMNGNRGNTCVKGIPCSYNVFLL